MIGVSSKERRYFYYLSLTEPIINENNAEIRQPSFKSEGPEWGILEIGIRRFNTCENVILQERYLGASQVRAV